MREDPVVRKERAERGRRYLNRVTEARKRVWEYTERIEQCAGLVSRCGTVLGMQRATAGAAAGMEAGISAIEKLRDRLGEELEGYEARVREAEWAIDQLDDPIEKTILRFRYLCDEDYGAITDRLHYSDERYVRKLCADGLSHLRLPRELSPAAPLPASTDRR